VHDLDQQLRDLIDGAADPVTLDDIRNGMIVSTHHGERHALRRPTLLIAVGVALVSAVAIVALALRRENQSVSTTEVTTPAADTTSTPTSLATSSPTTAPHSADPLLRPVLNIAGCQPSSASQGHVEHQLFARRSSKPVPVQIVADTSRSMNDAYVVVERFFADTRAVDVGSNADVNGAKAQVFTAEYGQGSVTWLLPDGSEAYVRSRGFDADQLLTIARALTPRPADAAIAGFDISPDASSTLRIVAESADGVAGDYVGSACTFDDGTQARVSVLTGDLTFQYGTAMDWLPLPTIARRGDSLVSVTVLPGHDGQAALESVTNASVEEWSRLLAAPPVKPG
jgi:uncharacterized protein YoaH (UPF0181 family)